jgi:hypothetical protein
MVIEKLQSRGDEMAVLLLHDNELRTFKIIGLDDKMAKTIGFVDDSEQDFLSFIASKKQRDLINDIYDDPLGRDFIDILKYLPNLSLVKADGGHSDFEFRAVREMPRGHHHVFKMIFYSNESIQQKQSIMRLISENIAENMVLDYKINLPNADSTGKALEIVANYASELKIAYLCVEFESDFSYLLPMIGTVIRVNLRQNDFIGLNPDNSLGLILLDVDEVNLSLAINRLRMNMWQSSDLRQHFNNLNLRFGAAMIEPSQIDLSEIFSHIKESLQRDQKHDLVFYKK